MHKHPLAMSLSQANTRLLKVAPWALVAGLALACTSSGNGNGGKGGDGGGGGSNNGEGGGNSGGNSGTGGGGGMGMNEGGGPGTGGMMVPPPPGSNACGPLPAAPVRRLSKTEYMAAVRDLFPKLFPPFPDGVWRYDSNFLRYMRPGTGMTYIDTHLAGNIVTDPNTFGFTNRAKNLNPTLFALEVYDELALSLAEALVNGRDKMGNPLNVFDKPCTEATVDCGKQIIAEYGPKFFRRPMSGEEKQRYEKFFQDEFDAASAAGGGVDAFKSALSLTLEVFLQSPQFLYRLELGDESTKADGAIKLTQDEIASRLSSLFWNTGPDKELMDAAATNKLASADELEKQARRMLADKKFRYTITEFFRQWADFERIFAEGYRRKPGYSLGDPRHPYPIFYALGARYDIESFVEWAFADSDGSMNTLFTATRAMATPHAKALYTGVRIPDAMEHSPGAAQEYTPPEGQRAGILTRPLIPWAYAHFDTPNPPLRGSFMLSKVLCRHLPPPPADAMTLAGMAKLPAGSSNRQQFEARIAISATCKGCHQEFDPLGFAMEKYNEIGMYLQKDAKNGQAINASGKLEGTDVDGDFTDLVDLSKKFARSSVVQACMVQQFYEYATGRDVYDPETDSIVEIDKCRLEAMDKAVRDANGDLREALVAYVKSADFIWRPAY